MPILDVYVKCKENHFRYVLLLWVELILYHTKQKIFYYLQNGYGF